MDNESMSGKGPDERRVRPDAEAKGFDLPGMRRVAGLLSHFSAQAILECADEIDRLRADISVLHILLARYRDETPLGHQPHLIAHLADAALGRA